MTAAGGCSEKTVKPAFVVAAGHCAPPAALLHRLRGDFALAAGLVFFETSVFEKYQSTYS